MKLSPETIHLLPAPKNLILAGGVFRRKAIPLRCSGFNPEHLLDLGVAVVQSGSNTADLILEEDSSLLGEAYILIISDQLRPNISIRSATSPGARNGIRTLAQILKQFPNEVPCLTIEDEPAFTHRGVMLDISRNRVPRMDELFRVVNQLASWKINHLQLYTEHTFRYRNHNQVWRGASPFTPNEIRALDAECRRLGITLAANQNCFGHMNRWLKHPAYSHLAETLGEWEWEGRMLPGPFSLCPLEADSIELVEDMLGQLLPNFSSGLVNIGCDETLDLGQGKSKDEVSKRGRADLYFDFLHKIDSIVHRNNYRPMFWADIALSHPESLEMIPTGMIALAWGYEPDAPFGQWCKALKEVGSEVWVCPGTSSWRSIVGRTSERQCNILAAVDQGIANGTSGILMTDWGDEGHRQEWPVALIGLAEAADVAWSGRSNLPDNETLDALVFEGSQFSISAWLRELGDADKKLRLIYGRLTPDGRYSKLRNASALYNEMHGYNFIGYSDPDIKPLWNETLSIIRQLVKARPSSNDQITAELFVTAEMAEVAASVALLRFGSDDGSISRKGIIGRFKEAMRIHRNLWLKRSRFGGLDESMRYYRTVLSQMKREFL